MTLNREQLIGLARITFKLRGGIDETQLSPEETQLLNTALKDAEFLESLNKGTNIAREMGLDPINVTDVEAKIIASQVFKK